MSYSGEEGSDIGKSSDRLAVNSPLAGYPKICIFLLILLTLLLFCSLNFQTVTLRKVCSKEEKHDIDYLFV